MQWAWLLALLLALCHPAAVASHHEATVLVLYSNSRLLPATIEGDRGLRQAIRSSAERPVLVLDEFLDMPRMGGQAYEDTVRTYLHDKYAPRPPHVVIAGGDEALGFLLKYRDQLFPGVAVVHMSATQGYLRAHAPLPAGVVGVPIELQFSRTIEQALQWHPKARRVVVVTGNSPPDRAWESQLRTELPRFAPRATAEFLSGLPRAELLKRLGALTDDSVVFTPGFYQDGNGQSFTPRGSAEALATASTAPVYAPFNTFIGTGVVGGVVPNFEAMGHQAGEIVNALLGGAAPASLALPQRMPTALVVDWRQVRRWGIAEAAIPHDAVLQFNEPTLWQAHRNEVIAAAVVFLLQAGMIGGLVLERRRRRLAENAVQKQRIELVHASRLAVAGEMTASIAHEINQPLGAILSNADTAELLLESGEDRRDALRTILADIRRDDLRASEVIRRLRTLLARHEAEHARFNVNAALSYLAPVLHAEAHRRQVQLDVEPAATPIEIIGDRVQIQQVVMNLALNAMDAVASLPEPRRSVVVSCKGIFNGVAITVRDRGQGIADEHLPRLFDSFFSTKRKGMGLGLSISRTIVEAHGGRIWAENDPAGGAVFHVKLPAAGVAAMPVEGRP